jgi:hypothetical protein
LVMENDVTVEGELRVKRCVKVRKNNASCTLNNV